LFKSPATYGVDDSPIEVISPMAALVSQPQNTTRQVSSRLPSTPKRLPDLTPPSLQGELHTPGLLAEMPDVIVQQRVQGPGEGSDVELQVMEPDRAIPSTSAGNGHGQRRGRARPQSWDSRDKRIESRASHPWSACFDIALTIVEDELFSFVYRGTMFSSSLFFLF
jgi:hypothetical protein